MSTTNEKSLKLIFVIRYFHPFIGGLEKKALNLAAALVQKGIAVEIVTSRFFTVWPRQETIKGVRVYRLLSPRIKVVGAFIYLFFLCAYLVNNRKAIRLIHAFQAGYSSAAAITVGILLGKPTILNLAGSGSGGDICRHKRMLWGRVFLTLCRQASRIVIVNQEMYRELQTIEYDDTSIVLIPNGVDLKEFSPASDRKSLKSAWALTDKRLVVYTGRLSLEKGVYILIRAFSKLSPEVPAILYIIGDGPEQSQLKGLISTYRLENKVYIREAVDNIAPFLQAADIFVMPSRHEGLSNSILEAMACGVPVIATHVEGNAELIEDGVNGLLVTPENEAELAQALSLLLKDKLKGAELARHALRTVHQKYHLVQMVEQYIQLYHNIA
jgi:glycosyltransferase involved in cell wall biosynthesis